MERIVCYSNLNVIDITKEKAQIYENVNIVTKGDRILYIGAQINAEYQAIVDCKSMFAIPSLIDMHVHITFNPLVDGEMSLSIVPVNLSKAAENGICLMRDVGMPSQWNSHAIEMIKPNYTLPEVVYSGSPVCVYNGHGYEYGTHIDSDGIDDYIKSHMIDGNRWIKIMNDPENHSLQFLTELVDKAHKHGMKVSCHVFRRKGLELAIQARCDTIEHVIPGEDVIKEYGELALAPYYVPTLYSAAISYNDNYLDTIPKEDAQYIKEWYELLNQELSRTKEARIKLLCGTDAGCCPSSFGDIVQEMVLMASYGISNEQILKSSTIIAAKCLEMSADYGSIEVGKYANFLCVPHNPLEDISNLRDKRLIVLRGSILKDEMSVICH